MQIQAQKVAFAGGKSYMYRVYLKDKKGGSYSLRHPEKFLSAKALARRERQGLAVDSTDLPVSSKYIGTLRHDQVDHLISHLYIRAFKIFVDYPACL